MRLKLRYSLRTFLIATALGVLVASFFGYHVHVKGQRQALLAEIEARGGFYITYDDNTPAQVAYIPELDIMMNPSKDVIRILKPRPEKAAQVSRVRAWLGDAPIRYITLGSADKNPIDLERVYALFPEALVDPSRSRFLSDEEAEMVLAEMRKLMGQEPPSGSN